MIISTQSHVKGANPAGRLRESEGLIQQIGTGLPPTVTRIIHASASPHNLYPCCIYHSVMLLRARVDRISSTTRGLKGPNFMIDFSTAHRLRVSPS
jgi:hypothetical protein